MFAAGVMNRHLSTLIFVIFISETIVGHLLDCVSPIIEGCMFTILREDGVLGV